MKHHADMKCPLRDGTLLNFDLFQPDEDGAHPVILMRTPYTKACFMQEKIYACPERLIAAGYCVMVQECRGTGKSGGTLSANAEHEYPDGFDTINWITAQPWCDGNVGMFGLSYFGFTQLAAASRAPKALKAICPFMTQAAEPFGTQLTQTYNYFHLTWIYGQIAKDPERFIPDAERRNSALEILRSYAPKLTEYAMHLPANENPAALVEGVPILKDYLDLLNGVESEAFWRRIHHPTDYTQTHCAMFHCTGWFDVCLDSTIHNWNAVQATADDYTRQHSRLLIGPWSHGGSFHAKYDTIDFGDDNTGTGQDVTGQMIAWFDCYLKQQPQCAAEAAKVRYYIIGANEWRDDISWPPAAVKLTPFYLHTGHKLNSHAPEPSEAEPEDHYQYDPQHPSPSFAPPQNGKAAEIGDYAPISQRSDVLTYTTEPLLQSMTIAGQISMELYAATDAVDTDFACRVLDVAPDGVSRALNAGLLRGKWRKGLFQYELITPGKAELYSIEIGNAAWQIHAGHRLAIQVCSALFPLCDRNLNTGEPSSSCNHALSTNQTIFHDALHPSRLLLPLLKDE